MWKKKQRIFFPLPWVWNINLSKALRQLDEEQTLFFLAIHHAS
jgi:hypothetical protein